MSPFVMFSLAEKSEVFLLILRLADLLSNLIQPKHMCQGYAFAKPEVACTFCMENMNEMRHGHQSGSSSIKKKLFALQCLHVKIIACHPFS